MIDSSSEFELEFEYLSLLDMENLTIEDETISEKGKNEAKKSQKKWRRRKNEPNFRGDFYNPGQTFK